MIDRAAIRRYDEGVANRPSSSLPTEEVRVGTRGWATVVQVEAGSPAADHQVDVVVAGGGPAGMLHGALLARQGHSVLVAERKPSLGLGVTWNLSHAEFKDLGRTGAFPLRQLCELAAGIYREGVFRIHDGPVRKPLDFHFDEICNISMEEEKFFSFLEANWKPQVWLSTMASLFRVTRDFAYVACDGPRGRRVVRCRLFLDARGWTSPLAALAHPGREYESVYNIVGVHTEKLRRETNSDGGRPVGLIAATYENEIDSAAGRVQPILERFSQYVPHRHDGGEVLYYFTRTALPTPLAQLVDDMLERLPAMVPDFHVSKVRRTYYGHIPAYYPPPLASGRAPRTSAGHRTLLVGSAARQYSGLTGCAFGALARNAARISRAVHGLLAEDALTFEKLRRVDIDPRERVSQAVEELFGGAMELDEGEPEGTVNRDWILLMRAAESMDERAKNEAFRDKIVLRSLNQLVSIALAMPGMIEALLRNNEGHIGTVVWTFLHSYARLLVEEIVLLVKRRRGLYLRGSTGGVLRTPQFLFRSARLFRQGARAGRARRRQGGKGESP